MTIAAKLAGATHSPTAAFGSVRQCRMDPETDGQLSQLVLAQLFESMLPKVETPQRAGVAGDVWRSMLAAELGRTMSERGVSIFTASGAVCGDHGVEGGVA